VPIPKNKNPSILTRTKAVTSALIGTIFLITSVVYLTYAKPVSPVTSLLINRLQQLLLFLLAG